MLRTDLIIMLVYLSQYHLYQSINLVNLPKREQYRGDFSLREFQYLWKMARLSVNFDTEICCQQEQSVNGMQQNFITRVSKAMKTF